MEAKYTMATTETTTEKHAAVIEAIQSGKTFTDAAEALGLSRQLVGYIARRWEAKHGAKLTRGKGGSTTPRRPDTWWGQNRAKGLCGACGKAQPIEGEGLCAGCKARHKGSRPAKDGSPCYVASPERRAELAAELESMRWHCVCGLRGQHECIRAGDMTRGPSRLALAEQLAANEGRLRLAEPGGGMKDTTTGDAGRRVSSRIADDDGGRF